MRIRVMGNAGGSAGSFYSTSSLVDGNLLLDAGTGVQTLPLAEALKIDDVLLTHSHLDHTAMLCFMIDSRIGAAGPLDVHCLPETARAIRKGFFNGDIWPDVENIKINNKPMMRFHDLKAYKTVTIKGRRITPLPVQHAVPTLAYCLHGERENFVHIADILDAEPAFWEYLRALPRFRRMTIEVSFPDEMTKVAEASYHLTPKMLKSVIKKIPDNVQLYYCHTKPQVYDKVTAQLKAYFGDRVRPLRRGQIFVI